MSDYEEKDIDALREELTKLRSFYSRVMDGFKKQEQTLHILKTENKLLSQHNNSQKIVIDQQRQIIEKYQGYEQANLGLAWNDLYGTQVPVS